MNINYEKLREDLKDYFGTAIKFMPMAIMELSKVESASNEELINIALKNGFDLNNYTNHKKY